MKFFARWLGLVCLMLAVTVPLCAEKVSDLPAPTGYVNDFAGVLSPATRQSVEDLCLAVDRQAHAQIAVVTIHKLEDDQSIEEFATELEDKWKVGTKGTDRGVLMIFVMNPTRGRIEVGYGLEGILNDAKVGDIGRAMAPYAQRGDYNQAIPLGVQQIAGIIAADAGVTLQSVRHYRGQTQPQPSSPLHILFVGGGILLVVIFLVATGNTGFLWFILGSMMGGGGGGGGGRDDDRGDGFGGFGGGSSGGGGASGNF